MTPVLPVTSSLTGEVVKPVVELQNPAQCHAWLLGALNDALGGADSDDLQKIDRVCDLILSLAPPERFVKWLGQEESLLGNERPLDLLKKREWWKVEEHLMRLQDI